MTRYEVQMIACDGTWLNAWFVHYHDGTVEPETFPSFTEAWEAVLEFIDDINDEIACGQREADEGYSVEEFRVTVSSA